MRSTTWERSLCLGGDHGAAHARAIRPVSRSRDLFGSRPGVIIDCVTPDFVTRAAHQTAMRRLFYVGVALLVLFEAANVYFIMPLPFSQRVRSIDAAYFLYAWRWLFRGIAGAMLIAGIVPAWRAPGWRRALVPTALLVPGVVASAPILRMSANQLSPQPASLAMLPLEQNTVEP